MSEYLDFAGLQLFYQKIAKIYATKAETNVLLQEKTCDEWLAAKDEIPAVGTILVYTDRTIVGEEYIPDIKIADGKRTVEDLPFLVERNFASLVENYSKIIDDTQNEIYLLGASQDADTIKRNTGISMQAGTLTAEFFNGVASIAKKIEHSLTIGENVFDGSSDINIPIYKGDIN